MKRLQKREVRKGKRKHNPIDSDASDDDMNGGILSLPSDKRKKKQLKGTSKKHKPEATRTEFRKSSLIVDIDFSNLPPFNKAFWQGQPGNAEPTEQLKSQRRDIGVLVKDNLELCPPPLTSLEDAVIPPQFLTVCKELKISQPRPIQMQGWPCILNGSDVLAIAPTGSGKTLAYCLPMIPHILDQIKHTSRDTNGNRSKGALAPYALVIVPTRELAMQVAAVVKQLRRSCGITGGCLYGGHDKAEQLQGLRALARGGGGEESNGQLHVLVATPGRPSRCFDHKS